MGPRVRIFVGAYGSGKTEVAVEVALARVAAGARVALADLDLVNPYFRSRHLRDELEAAGVQLVSPPGAWSEADLPIIVPQVRGVIQNPGLEVVLDVGGDDSGATALARFAPFLPSDTQVSMVVNDRRPWTGDAAGIRKTIARIEGAGRVRVGALVANPNLGAETDLDVVRGGAERLAAAAAELGLPLHAVVVRADLAEQLGTDTLHGAPVLRLTRRLSPVWTQDPNELLASSRDRRAAMFRPPRQA